MLKSRYFIYGILVLTIIGMVFVGGCIKKQNLSGEELFFVIKDIFVNNGFTPDDLNPSFEGYSFGTCFYNPGGYEEYQLSIKFKNFGGAFFNHIYYFDDVYNTSEEEIAEKINNKGHYSAAVKSTQNGKYIEESRPSSSSFIILCGHKAIIDVPFIEKHSNSDKFLEVVDEILHECNKFEELPFPFKIEEISYDCFKSENLFSYHLYVEKSSEDRGVVDDIIISYPKGAKLPVGEWKINTQVLTPSGDNYFENNAAFKEFFLRPCNLSGRNCFSPFSYGHHFIPSPYVEGGSILVIVTSPDGKVEKKEVPLPDKTQ